jgi:hypothetical protein
MLARYKSFPRLLVELLQCPLPVLPVKNVVFTGRFVRGEQGREGLLTGFRPDSAKAEGEDELAVAGGQVDFGSQRDVSVFRTLVFPRHFEMLRQVLPAVRYADKSDGTFQKRRGTGQGKRAGLALGKKHGLPLVLVHPAGIATPEISQVRSQQCVEAVVAQIPLERYESDSLQHHVSPRIGQHFLFDPVPALHARIGQFIDRHSGLDRKALEGTMPLFFGEEAMTVGDDQAEVAGAGLVHPGKINLIENAVTQREPNPAVEVQRRAYSGLGARSPAGFDSGPAGRVSKVIVIAHSRSSSPSSSLPERCGFVLDCHRKQGRRI